MKKLISTTVGLVALGFALSAGTASARDLTVVSWGGNYQDAQREIYFKPFAEKTGKPVLEESWDGGYGVIAAKMETVPANWDVVQVEAEELALGCADGLYEQVDWSALGGEDKFIPSAVNECGVGAIVWTTGLSYDGDKLKEAPQSWADFWDTEKFPGKRGFRRGPKYALEFALMADGVKPEEVYEVLGTDEGIDRAFAKLDALKSDIVWWEAGAQPIQLLASGEAPIGFFWNGRLAALAADGMPVGISWENNITAADALVVPKGAPNKEAAMAFIAEATSAQAQADFATKTGYAPINTGSAELMDAEIRKTLPDTQTATQINADMAYWAEHRDEIGTRWYAWQAE